MRISDWSSDVCSSDLQPRRRHRLRVDLRLQRRDRRLQLIDRLRRQHRIERPLERIRLHFHLHIHARHSFTENRNPSPPTGEGCAAFSLLPSRSWERVRGLLAHRQHRPQSPAPAPASASPPDSLRQDRAPATRAAQSRAPPSPDTRRTILSAPRARPAPPPLDASPAPRRAARAHLRPTSPPPPTPPPPHAANP